MRICLKRQVQLDKGKTLQKHQEGYLTGIHWTDKGVFYYYVDFGKEGVHTVESSECDVLNL